MRFLKQSLAVVGILTSLAIIFLVVIVTRIESELARVIVGGAITILASVITVSLSKIYESRERIEQENRSKRMPVYEELVEFVFDVLQQGKTRKKMSEQELMKRFAKSMEHMIVWGSDTVLRQFSLFRLAAVKAAEEPVASQETVFSLEQLLFAIRKDLGHENRNLQRGDLLRFFVTDIDDHLTSRAER